MFKGLLFFLAEFPKFSRRVCPHGFGPREFFTSYQLAREPPSTTGQFLGRLRVVGDFLASGANKNIRGGGGHTALHEAAGRGYTAIESALLNSGAGKDSLDNVGDSPLMWQPVEVI